MAVAECIGLVVAAVAVTVGVMWLLNKRAQRNEPEP